MSAYEQDRQHDHEHGHDHDHDHDSAHDFQAEHEHDRHLDGERGSGVRDDGPGTARLFEAASAGRTDVVGASGLGILQRAVGNGAVGAMVQRSRSAGAKHTEEAPEVAEAEPAETPGARSPVHDVLASGGGQPLDTDTRGDMEARMGADFSDVRIHTDTAADASAKGIGAHAYTVGNNVVFQRDAYDPASSQGRTTLAHELTHVIQQRSGPVDGTEAPGGIRVSDPSDRFEREAVANAERVTADPAPVAAPEPAAATGPAPAAAAPAVQRAATEDEDEQPADVQGSFVQRSAEGGAEEEEEAPPA
ncbi:eCIS core domain-containing protein [Streptomyces laurentii]|uniref:eCIS core domain-containing protein n=1 Tax=Streptomyces laurentii TaxID=39478 RepID=UPI00368BBF63